MNKKVYILWGSGEELTNALKRFVFGRYLELDQDCDEDGNILWWEVDKKMTFVN